MSRLKYTGKNIVYGYISSITTILLKFILRTIFIGILGATYLGVNGLFTNVLGVLSFAELGFGVAMNFALYKPVAEENIEKIKSLLLFYKRVYRIIALIITVIGLGILPFLSYIIKDPGDIGNVSIYYLIFLFNTVSSYFITYKYGLLTAHQKDYIVSNINSITAIVTTALQIVVLLVFKDFLMYLIIAAVVGLAQKIFANIYINNRFPYLKDKNVAKLSKEELQPIRKNTIALIWHKLGSISVHQTDNIIISAFISVTMVGIVSNYNLLLTSVTGLLIIIFNSATGSFGNLIATESKEKQYRIFKVYRFAAFWIFGFSAVAFFILATPFVTLWIGGDMVIPEITWALIVINFYMSGDGTCIGTIKSAGGVFDQDKYVAVLQAVVNLVVSIVLVQYLGLVGVYVGTLAQRLVATIIKPIIVYREVFGIKSRQYFVDWVKFAVPVATAAFICWYIKDMVFQKDVMVVNFIAMCGIVVVVTNVVFYVIFRKNTEFLYIKDILLRRFRRGRNV